MSEIKPIGISEIKRLPILGEKISLMTHVSELGNQKPTMFKRQLKGDNYPIDGCLRFSNYFFEANKKTIESTIFDSKTLLIPAPSSSKFNPLPRLFADRIAELKQCHVIREDAISPGERAKMGALGEAKNAKLLSERNSRFAPYILNEQMLAEYAKEKYTNIILVDDMITTGETVVNLSKQLEASGLKATAALGMVTFANTYPTEEQLKSVVDKVTKKLKLDKDEAIIFSAKVDKVFGEYTTIRLSREIKERTFSTFEKAGPFKTGVEKAYDQLMTLEKGVNLNKGSNLSR